MLPPKRAEPSSPLLSAPPLTSPLLIGPRRWQFFIALATPAGLAVRGKQEEGSRGSDPSPQAVSLLPPSLLENTESRGRGNDSPLTMFQISEFQDETFSASEKDPADLKLSVGGAKDLNSPSHENPELRRRIGSDQLDSETSDEVGAFRARSRSAPPILWAAQRYGRELRRMSDEFHGALQKLPRPKSAGTCSHMDHPPSWKDTLRSWWRRSCPENGPSGS